MPAVRKARKVVSKAIRPLIEELESRELLTTVVSTSATTPTYFEYQDAKGQAVRVVLQGNIKVDLIGSNVDPGSNALGLNNLPGDLITAGGVRQRVGGGFGGVNGIMPVTSLNTAARTVNEKSGPAYENITDVPAPAGDGGLGNLRAPSTLINIDGLASNDAGQTYGFNVVPATTNGTTTSTKPLVQLVQLDNTTGRATVVDELVNDAFFGPVITTTTGTSGTGATATIVAPTIGSADFLPSDDSKLYFIANVPITTGTTSSAQLVPELFVYDFSKPLGSRVSAVTGAFDSNLAAGNNASVTVVHGMTFDPNTGDLWVYATAPNPFGGGANGQNTTITGLFNLGDPTAAGFTTDNLTQNNEIAVVAAGGAALTGVTSIEFLGSGPGDINNDPNGIYIVAGTSIYRADITNTRFVAGVQTTTAVNLGPLPDPDDTTNPTPRGTNIVGLTYNPTILNPFFLEDDPTSTRRGVFEGTDATTDELVFIDFRNRYPDSDLYSLYVTKADPNGSSTDGKIAISEFTRGTAHSVTLESMNPYGTGVSLRVLQQNGQETTTAPGLGSILLGAQSVVIGTATQGINAGNVPFNTASVPANTFGVLPSTISTLSPGLIVASGVSLDKFLFAGTITGQVQVADSINTFYAGGIVTGDASGGEFGTSSVTQNFFDLANPGNFSFGGELRELVVGNDLGVNGDPTAGSTYASGFSMHIVGRLGEERVFGNAALNGIVDGLDNASSLPGTIVQGEVEYVGNVTPNHSTVSDFQNFNLSTHDMGSGGLPVSNDSTPQYLGTFNSTIVGGVPEAMNNVIQLRGVLQNHPSTNGGDSVDEYAVGLLAGQVYQFSVNPMSYPNGGSISSGELPDPSTWTYGGSGSFSLQIIDPDGNVVATDSNDVDGSATSGQLVGFKVDRPGNYTIKISTNLSGIDQPYELVGLNVGDLAIGGIHASGFAGDVAPGALLSVNSTQTQLNVHQTPSLQVTHNSVGEIQVDGALVSNSFNTIQIAEDLGGILTPSIGIGDSTFASNAEPGNGNFGEGITLSVGRTIGLIRTTNGSAPTDLNRDATTAMAYEIQMIDAAGLLYGNIYANGPIGIIRAGDFALGAGPAMLIAANFDNTGNDGTIDLIETTGDSRNPGEFGTLAVGGPGITTGPGGNVRYIRSAGTLYRDRFFGGAQPETTSYTAGQTVNMVDDSGSTISIIPGPLVANPNFNQLLPEDPVTNPRFVGPFANAVNTGGTGTTTQALPAAPHITLETYPIRGSGGSVIVQLITDGGITLTSSGPGTNGGVEISSLQVEQGINYNNVVIDGNPVTLDANNNPVIGVPATAGTGTTNIPTTGAGSSNGTNNFTTVTSTGGTTTIVSTTGNVNTTPGSAVQVVTTAAPFTFNTTAGTVTLNNIPINIVMNGSARVDIYDLIGNDVDSITNTTGGEIVNTDLANLGILQSNGNLGFSNSVTGVSVRGATHVATHGVAWPTGVYPIGDQTTGLLITGNVVAIRSSQAIGNVVVGSYGGTVTTRTSLTGNIGEVTANSDGSNNPNNFEGIVGNVVASNRINLVRIGEGILPTGSGNVSRAGVYASGPIGVVTGSNADIRGNIASNTSIGSVNLSNGSIINANIDVFQDIAMSSDQSGGRVVPETNQPVNNPIYQIGSINLNGNGGIIGGQIIANSIGPITVGGFGIFDSRFGTLGDGRIGDVRVGGYGIRDAIFQGGASMGNITVNTSGAQLPTSSISADVRQSEFGDIDPYFYFTPNQLTDIHATLGTSASTPVINGETNQGILEDVVAVGSRNLGNVTAFQIRGSQPQQAVSGVNQPTDASYFNFGNSIGTISTTSIINGLKVVTGSIKAFKPGSDVLATSLTVSSKISSIKINGSLADNSIIQTVGPNSTIGSINIKNNLDGSISSTGKIGTITVGGNLDGSLNIHPMNVKGTSLNKITVWGDIVSGSFNVDGSIGQIISMGSLGQPGDLILVNGNLGSLIVGKSKTTNASLNANVQVLGNLKSLQVIGMMTGNLDVRGSVGTLSVVADAGSAGQNILTGNVTASGSVNKLVVSGGSYSGNLNAFGVGTAQVSFGNIQPSSSIVSGAGIKSVTVKQGNLFGNVRAQGGDIGTIGVDGSIGDGVDPMTISANNIRSIKAGGSMFSNSEIDAPGTIGSLFLGGDFDSGAIIRTSAIGKVTILGANNGQIIIA